MSTVSKFNLKFTSLLAVGTLASLSSYYLWKTYKKKLEFLHSAAIVGSTTIACLAIRQMLYSPDTDKKEFLQHCMSEWDKKKQSTSDFLDKITSATTN
mgnify:CR=1 FL=1